MTSRIMQRGQRKRLPDMGFTRGFLLLLCRVFIFLPLSCSERINVLCCRSEDKRLRMYLNRKTEGVYKVHSVPELLRVTCLPPSAPRQLLKHTRVMKVL